MGIIVHAIIPKNIKSNFLDPAVLLEQKVFAKPAIQLFEQTTKGWRREKPKYTAKHEKRGNQFITTILLTGSDKTIAVWGWIDEGTKPHIIRPKYAPALRFSPGYQRGSTPGQLLSHPSTPGDEPEVRVRKVEHPGSPAVGWTPLIEKEALPIFAFHMLAAIHRAADASGHKYP